MNLHAFVDYENIRISLRESFLERVGPAEIIGAIRQIASELGELRGIWFYGDWTRRPEDGRIIEENGCRAVNVFLTRMHKDRSDMTMAFHIDDMTREQPDIGGILVVSGDADFREPIVRGRERGRKMYVCAVGETTARELLTQVEAVFPIESALELTPKIPVPAASEWDEFVRRLDSLEGTLPYVVRNYFRDTILDAAMGYGETASEKDASIERVIAEGIVGTDVVPNPKVSGRNVIVIKLARDHELVRSILAPQKEI